MDTLILYALITKTPISFGYILMRHMEECVNSLKPLSLPYAMLLTLFFKHFGVDLQNKEFEEVVTTLKGRATKKGGPKASSSGKGKNVDVEASEIEDESESSSPIRRKKHSNSKRKRSNKMKNFMSQFVNELISFTDLQRNLLLRKTKEDNDAERQLKHAKTRWKLLKNQLDDMSSSDSEEPSDSREEDRVPSDT